MSNPCFHIGVPRKEIVDAFRLAMVRLYWREGHKATVSPCGRFCVLSDAGVDYAIIYSPSPALPVEFFVFDASAYV